MLRRRHSRKKGKCVRKRRGKTMERKNSNRGRWEEKGVGEWTEHCVAFNYTNIEGTSRDVFRDFRSDSISHSFSHFRNTTYLL